MIQGYYMHRNQLVAFALLFLAANLSRLCNPVGVFHQHLLCDVLRKNMDLRQSGNILIADTSFLYLFPYISLVYRVILTSKQ